MIKKEIDQKRIVKYYQRQTEIENFLKVHKVLSANAIILNLHIDPKLVSELIKANAITIINDCLKWNDKIPNSHTLAKTMIEKVDKYYHSRPSRIAIPETNNIVDAAPNVTIIRKPRKKVKSDGLLKRIWKAILNK